MIRTSILISATPLTAILLSAVLVSTAVTAKPKVPIEQCAKWHKLAEKYESARRAGYNISRNRKQHKKLKQKMLDANCPARHNKYFN